MDIGDHNSSDKHFTANDAHNTNRIKLIPSYIWLLFGFTISPACELKLRI